MKALVLILCVIMAGCSTVNCNFRGSNNIVMIEQPKTVQTSPTLQADGNTVPVSAVP